MNGYLSGLVMIITGLFTIAFGSYFYISSGFCAGPRDNLMIAIKRKTGLAVGFCRGLLEESVSRKCRANSAAPIMVVHCFVSPQEPVHLHVFRRCVEVVPVKVIRKPRPAFLHPLVIICASL